MFLENEKRGREMTRKDSLKERAQNLLPRIRGRPYMLELTGSPSSGKTTIKKILDTFYRRCGFRVAVPLEGAEAIRHISRKTHLYNVRTGIYALKNLIDYSVSGNYDLVIFDRCLFDAFGWMRYWYERGDIDEARMVMLQQFFTSPQWLCLIDAAFVIVADPETVESREQEINILDEDGETTNSNNILRLIRIFGGMQKEFFAKGAPMQFIDTSDLPKREMARVVLGQTLDLLEAAHGNR
ncbi:MAG: hypothetical protein A3J67_01185 [Parcubacteria group bacterium RIFCSPHIGHO2_02_FULL_48_10b]|nr:MAG: hypothetical protein A3J67_01185 [Parcubacteria group bacterium RIFCSPHIGHO2_02_FULL_48_10b]